MHPKNSTTHAVRQAALLTTAQPFHDFDCTDKTAKLLMVRPGMLCSEALSSSSNLLSAVGCILDRLLEGGMSAQEIYGVRFLVESASAFVDACATTIELGNTQGGEA